MHRAGRHLPSSGSRAASVVAAAIVVMGRTQHTNDITPKVEAEVEKLNHDGSLPAGVTNLA